MENLVELTGVAKVSVKSDFSPEDNKTKHTLNLSVDVSEKDIEAVRTLTKQKGNWYLTLGVEGVQATLDQAMQGVPEDNEAGDPTMAARVEEAAGQRAG